MENPYCGYGLQRSPYGESLLQLQVVAYSRNPHGEPTRHGLQRHSRTENPYCTSCRREHVSRQVLLSETLTAGWFKLIRIGVSSRRRGCSAILPRPPRFPAVGVSIGMERGSISKMTELPPAA